MVFSNNLINEGGGEGMNAQILKKKKHQHLEIIMTFTDFCAFGDSQMIQCIETGEQGQL